MSTAGVFRGFDEGTLLFFAITLEPRVEWCKQSMSLKYEPSSEPLYISAK